ncbi:MAG: hypothetical protein ABJF23_08810 [Bryobacteraceae bacterium]
MRLVLLLTLISLSSSAADRPDPFAWHGPVAPGLSVEIRGLNGDVRAEFSNGSEVEVYAQVSGAEPVHVDVIHHDGGVTVCTVSQEDPKQCSHLAPATGDARINYTVRVPKGVGLIGRTVNGEVEAQNLQGDVNAETVNGTIQISTSGKAQARTVNGNIVATCSLKSAALSTINGSITLETASLTNAAFQAETRNGAIITDFRIAGHRGLTSRRIGGKYGNGSREIRLKTVNGSIQLRRLS